MDREKLLIEAMKWWSDKIAQADTAEDVDWLWDQVRHLKYEIDSERKNKLAKVSKVPND